MSASDSVGLASRAAAAAAGMLSVSESDWMSVFESDWIPAERVWAIVGNERLKLSNKKNAIITKTLMLTMVPLLFL